MLTTKLEKVAHGEENQRIRNISRILLVVCMG
jgi:hypothetical protein